MTQQLGKDQLGHAKIGDSPEEFGYDYASEFEDLQETINPAGPDTAADRMYSHIKPAFEARDNENWSTLVEDFAAEFDQIKEARKEVAVSRYVETAIGQQLDRIGEFVQTPRKTEESDEHYRARLIVNFKSITAGGTIDDFLEVSETILETDPSNITIEEPHSTEPARVDLKVPDYIIQQADFTIDDYAGYLREIKAAGVKLQGVQLGGFTHRSEQDFLDGVNSQELAYNELDSNGEPKDIGGDYATLF